MAYAVLSELPIELPINKLKAVFFPLLDTLGITMGFKRGVIIALRLYIIRVLMELSK